jgi:anti-sigma factor RsiW
MTESGLPWHDVPDVCAQVQENLGLRGQHVLPESVEAAIEAHLLECTSCEVESAFVARLSAAKADPPGDLGMRILARALRESREAEAARTRIPARFGPWRSWAAAAAVVLAVFTGLNAGRWMAGIDAALDDLHPLAFVDPDLDAWAEHWFVAGAAVLEGVSDETLYQLALEMTP